MPAGWPVGQRWRTRRASSPTSRSAPDTFAPSGSDRPAERRAGQRRCPYAGTDADGVGQAHHERGRALRAEEIQYFSETARRIMAILLLGNGNEPAPTATEDSDPGKDAQLEEYEIAVQECGSWVILSYEQRSPLRQGERHRGPSWRVGPRPEEPSPPGETFAEPGDGCPEDPSP